MKKDYVIDQQTIRDLAGNLKTSVVELTKCGQHRSRQATMVGLGLQLSGLKRQLADPRQRAKLLARAKQDQFALPKGLPLTSPVQEFRLAGRKVITLNDRDAQQPVIVYLYGGAYLLPPAKQHWLFLDRLAQRSGARILVPDYPHLPEASAQDALAYLRRLSAALADQTPVSQITLMGDSAGGGLAAALVEDLGRDHLPMPGHLVLLSPWLDLSLQNPALARYNKRDLLLDLGGLQALGKQFAGALSPSDPRVSPLYGPVTNLRDVHLFVGTRELMCLDSIEFANRLTEAEVPVKLAIGRGLYHAYPLYQTPEGAAALKQIAAVVKGEDSHD